MKNRKTIILDMDGTLYQFKGGSLRTSGLYEIIKKNVVIFISKQLDKSEVESIIIFNSVVQKYGDSLSTGLEKDYNLNRYDYFNFVWNIEAQEFVTFDPMLKKLLLDLKQTYNLVLLSDAPRIWIDKVLDCFKITEIFEKQIFSGEGDIRKEFGNAIPETLKKLGLAANDCISVGDQEHTDIIPAKKLGLATIYVNINKSGIADYNINSIFELKKILKIVKVQIKK